MFDNHQDSSQLFTEQQLSKQQFDESLQQFLDMPTNLHQPKQTTSPFIFPQHQQSISEIAPETQRSPNLHMMGTSHNPLRSSLDYQEEDEQLYGFVMGTLGTGSVMMRHMIGEEDVNNMTQKTRPLLNQQDYYNDEDDSQLIPSVSPLQQQQHYEYFESKQHLVVWGRNQLGQLSLDPKVQNVVKNPVSIILSERIRGIGLEVKQISCGKAHTLILVEKCNTNFVYSFGCNKQGQLGIAKNLQLSIEPMLVEGLSKVSKIECSKNSSFALVNGCSSLYSWGSNKHGILGLGSSASKLKHQYHPEKVVFPSTDSLLSISAGGNHISALIQRKECNEQLENLLYIWGSNKYSQLGLGNNQSRSEPSHVNIPNEDFLTQRNKQIVNVACGDTFTIVSTLSGELYSCGSNLQGQLGLGDSVSSSRVNKFTKLSFYLKENDCVDKLTASNFSAVQMRSGDIYLWGPTPLGHFNIPKSLQTLQKERNEPRLMVQEISLGQSYGLIQDKNRQMYQLGSLFHENTQRMEDSNEVNTKNFNLNLIPGTFESFACGADFVVASSFSNQDEARGSSVRKGQNQSRSLTGHMPKKSFNFVEQSLEYGKQPQFTRYGATITQNLQNPSVCSSSLSPLRSSVISNRGDFLNRSASIAPNGIIQAAQQQPNIQQQLKYIRDSCTPVRDFEPPAQLQHVKTPTATDFYQNEGGCNYQTIQQSKNDDFEQQSHLDKSPQIPTTQSKRQHQSTHLQGSLPTSTTKQHQLETSHHFIAATTLDILIREKQELQHSLNIEIQKRLMAERDVEMVQRGQSGQERELRNEIASIKQEMVARQKAQEGERSGMQIEIEQLKAKNDNLITEVEMLNSQLAQVNSQSEQYILQHKSNQSSLEDLCARKAKEIYDLTVQLGCLKEENAQLRRDSEELRRDFEERLACQQQRAQTDYEAVRDEYTTYQLHSTQEAERNRIEITALTQLKDEQAAKIAKYEEKIRKMNEKLKSYNAAARTKKNSSLLRLEGVTVQSGSASISSNVNESYVSVSANPNRDEMGRRSGTQDHSFTSHQSKKSRTNKRDVSGKRVTTSVMQQQQDKENTEVAPVISTTPKMPNEVLFDTTQHLFNPIETPNESQKPQAISFDKKQPRPTTLFKKQTPSANIYQTLSQSMSSIDVIKPVKQQQQENPYGDNSKKKTASSKLNPASQSSSLSVLKTNTSRVVNQMNTIQVNVTKSALQKTPTRVLARSDTQSQLKSAPKHNPQQPSTSSAASAQSKSPMLQKQRGVVAFPHHKSKQTSTVSQQNPNSTANFQVNQDESSIFDIHQIAAATADQFPSHKGRSTQALPSQEMTLGHVDNHETSFERNNPTPQPVRQEKPVLPTVSSTSTLNNGCGLIMSEMRNKLIDIQNNKQYIEQKIQEYERKLVQLKGSSASSGLTSTSQMQSSASYFPYPTSSYYQEFINHPQGKHQQVATGFNTLAAAVNQLTKSSSGLLILNHSRDSGRHASTTATGRPQ